MIKIKPRERTAIIDSLRAGVVPRVGLQHIHVGRHLEVKELLRDFEEIKEGASKFRFIVGEYGSGKSFFLTLAGGIAHEKGFVSTKLDISTERTLYSRNKKAQSLYSELVKNLSLKTRPDGGALKSIVESWIAGKIGINTEVPSAAINSKLSYIKDFVSGYDFALIITKYYEGYINGDERLMDSCLRWLSGEYGTKSEAKNDLNVRSIISDANYYDYLKLLSRFIRDAGYKGLLVSIDELAVLTRLNSRTRTGNYETILKIYNDSLQGSLSGIYYLFGGTPEFIRHPTKGLYSYGALKTRLAANPFADEEHRDLSGPIIELDNLTKEELYTVFLNIRNVFARYEEEAHLINEEGIMEFMNWLYRRLGAESFLSPREGIKSYVHLLSQLENYPEKSWQELLGVEANPTGGEKGDGREPAELTRLSSFKL